MRNQRKPPEPDIGMSGGYMKFTDLTAPQIRNRPAGASENSTETEISINQQSTEFQYSTVPQISHESTAKSRQSRDAEIGINRQTTEFTDFTASQFCHKPTDFNRHQQEHKATYIKGSQRSQASQLHLLATGRHEPAGSSISTRQGEST